MNRTQFTSLSTQGYFKQITSEYDYFTAAHSDYGPQKWPTAFPDTFKEHCVAVKWHKRSNSSKGNYNKR